MVCMGRLLSADRGKPGGTVSADNQTCIRSELTPGPKRIVTDRVKGALYRVWCGVNRLGGSGVKVV